jgi:hypothetical protein
MHSRKKFLRRADLVTRFRCLACWSQWARAFARSGRAFADAAYASCGSNGSAKIAVVIASPIAKADILIRFIFIPRFLRLGPAALGSHPDLLANDTILAKESERFPSRNVSNINAGIPMH